MARAKMSEVLYTELAKHAKQISGPRGLRTESAIKTFGSTVPMDMREVDFSAMEMRFLSLLYDEKHRIETPTRVCGFCIMDAASIKRKWLGGAHRKTLAHPA